MGRQLVAGEALNRPIPITPTALPDEKGHRRLISQNLNSAVRKSVEWSTYPHGTDIDFATPITVNSKGNNADPNLVTNWTTIETLDYVIPDTFRGLWEYGATVLWETTHKSEDNLSLAEFVPSLMVDLCLFVLVIVATLPTVCRGRTIQPLKSMASIISEFRVGITDLRFR